ncbi:MAG: hypothetical protein HYR96_11360 [Deltaproteobacteria bacterium]|nr:hypothetical protein [Deltaproteobacteria bacterium]
MKLCFVVRNIHSQIITYTTTHLAYEAYLKGHEVVYATVNSFSYSDDQRVRATVISPGDGPFNSRTQFLDGLKGEQAAASQRPQARCTSRRFLKRSAPRRSSLEVP